MAQFIKVANRNSGEDGILVNVAHIVTVARTLDQTAIFRVRETEAYQAWLRTRSTFEEVEAAIAANREGVFDLTRDIEDGA